MRNLEVCMITGRFYPDYSGGGRQALLLSQALLEKNMKVLVFTFDLHKSVWSNRVAVDRVKDVTVYRVPGKARSKYEIPLRYARFVFECWKRRRAFDLIHGHGLMEGYLSLIVGKLTGKPTLAKLGGVAEITSHWFEYDSANGTWEKNRRGRRPAAFGKLVRRRLAGLVDRLVCTTSKIHSLCGSVGFPESRLVLIPNGVDVQHLGSVSFAQKAELRKLLNCRADEFIVATILSVRPIKGLDVLLEAWLKLESNRPRRLIVIGPNEKGMQSVDKDFAGHIHKLASRAPAGAPLVFAGEVSDVQPYLSAADAFVLPSRSEGFPNAALEAMASGLPCIFSDLAWTNGIIRDKDNALLFTSGESGELASCLRDLLENESLARKLAVAARDLAETHFDIRAISSEYVNLYRQLLQGEGRSSRSYDTSVVGTERVSQV